MGCGCGGGVTQWTPVAREAPSGDGADLSPNERIQRALRERATMRVWPATHVANADHVTADAE